MVYRVIVIDKKQVRLGYANSGISNDHGEYIMNCRASRANQHAEKCVDGTWLPMRVSKKVGWEGLKAKVGDIAALRRKSKKKMAKRDGEYCFSMDFSLEFCAFCRVSAVSHLGGGKLMM